ncbi:hypothetical protein TELCIR_24343 [Teladorsagia circumcincta]|uniref:Peptidase A2 domain-containing protein n=1 Tax=Teladorsagia circumcincta TaxID=45464 RepID=A0A2G9T8K1_TELCI|nr:hypothetical protein TELCIR_24343 [Teladorsagia circumcincta]
MNKLNTAYVNFQMSLPSHPDNKAEFISGKTSNARLMVVALKIQNESVNKEEQIYALLDSASDQSFITSSLSERLQLKPRSEVSITINSFGGHIEKKQVKRVEALLLNAKAQSMNVTLLTNDKITNPIPLLGLNNEDKFFLRSNFPNLRDFWLHNATTQVIPDILLGIDYFNIILQLNKPLVQLLSGLHMTPTIFGYVITGVPHNNNTQLEPPSIKAINVNHSQYTHEQRNTDLFDSRRPPNVDTKELHKTNKPKKHIVAGLNPINPPFYMANQAVIKTTTTTTKIKIVPNVSPE